MYFKLKVLPSAQQCMHFGHTQFYIQLKRENIGSPQINVVVYVLVIRSMMRSSLTRNKTQIEKVKAGVKASVVMFPLLGITWLFGLLSFSSETMSFKYLFAILNSLQGLMIFVFKVALNRQVRKISNANTINRPSLIDFKSAISS